MSTEGVNIRDMGRDSTYTPEIAAEICTRLAEGESLRAICQDPHMPHMSTVLRWALYDEQFREQYAHARAIQAEIRADELVEIADDGTNDWMEKQGRNGGTYLGADSEHIQRSKLRIDTRKWIAAKLLPKRYGDRIAHEHSGPDGKPIATESKIDPAHREQLLTALATQIAGLTQGQSTVDPAAGSATDDLPI